MAYFHSPRIITDGLVLALDAANAKSYPGSGTVWTDLSGNGNNGTLTNGPTFSSANLGSISFDGVDDYITYGDNSSFNSTLNGATNWSISYWVNPVTNGRILDRGNLGEDPTGALELNVRTVSRNNTAGGSSTLSTNIIGTGWNYVTLTRTSALLLNWYLNGIFSNSSQLTEDYGGSGIWKTGRRAASTDSMFQGNLSKLKIYNRVLTAAEILQNYNATKGRYGL
jgi:hypothetical protein